MIKVFFGDKYDDVSYGRIDYVLCYADKSKSKKIGYSVKC